jgi:aspartate aminotransferase-like enzyme
LVESNIKIEEVNNAETIPVSTGPTQIPPEVLLKMAEPIIHHRNPMFEAVVEQVQWQKQSIV